MKPEALQQLYDEAYAEQYNARFITHQNHGGKTAAEREVLGKAFDRIGPSARWLDLACGTGYFLAQFPNINRTGLDLSPGMLGYARKNNPDVPLVQGDFRNRDLFAPGSFDVISCTALSSSGWIISRIPAIVRACCALTSLLLLTASLTESIQGKFMVFSLFAIRWRVWHARSVCGSLVRTAFERAARTVAPRGAKGFQHAIGAPTRAGA